LISSPALYGACKPPANIVSGQDRSRHCRLHRGLLLLLVAYDMMCEVHGQNGQMVITLWVNVG